MKVYSHYNNNELPAGTLFTDESPLQFLKGFSLFYQKYFNSDVKIFYSEDLDAYIPVRLYKLRMFQFGQLLYAPIRNNEELNAAEQQQFFEELVFSLRKEQHVERLIQPHPSGILKAVPRGAQSCPFGTYINHLYQYNEEELLSAFDIKYRKAVNHSIKNGAEARFGWEHFDEFYKLYQNTTTRAGIHCDSLNYFTTLRACIGDEHMEIGVVYDQGQAIGGILMLYTKYSAMCTHAGSGGESKLYGGMKMLHYEMMKRLKGKGVRLYDLVGVRINSHNEALEGVFRFKKGFGGELKEGYLWKIDLSLVRTRVFDIMMRLRFRNTANLRDIIDEEST